MDLKGEIFVIMPNPTCLLEPATPPAAYAPTAEPPLTVIAAGQRGWLVNVSELWHYRELIYFLAWRDVKVRYKQTALGAAWAVLQPLALMAVFSLGLARLSTASDGGPPYPAFVYAGLLPWTLFAAVVGSAANSVIGAERIITKVYFPRLALPFGAAAVAVVDTLIASGLMIGLMAWYGIVPGARLLLAPLILGVVLVAATGVGTLLAALNVAYRDFRYVVPFLLQLGLFATPAIYLRPSATAGPPHWLLRWNPMNGLVAAFRDAVLGEQVDWPSLAASALAAFALLLVGCTYFRSVEDGFADAI